MTSKLIKTAVGAGLLALLLGACAPKKQHVKQQSVKPVHFAQTTSNQKRALPGGTLRVAVVDDSPIAGVFSEELTDDQYDTDFMSPAAEPLFGKTTDYHFSDSGAATIRFNNAEKTATITIKPHVRWSDGQPVVAKDVEYAYELVANKATQSPQYSAALENILGLKAYRDGQSKSISGISMPSGTSGNRVVLHFAQMKPGFSQSGNSYFLESAAPYHYLKDVPFDQLNASAKVRDKPLFFGPFKMTKVTPGQAVVFRPNPYYYKGKPKLAKIEIQAVSSSAIVTSLKRKQYDLVDEMPTDNYAAYKNVAGYKLLGQPQLGYTYLGFKVGHWDEKHSVNVMAPQAKMNNKALRQAMAYALNNDAINARYYPGMRQTATTLIPPTFKTYHANLKGYQLNLRKANHLLDAAGYHKGKDGYRTDPKGKQLTINFAAMAGNQSAQAIAEDYINQWRKIGLRVKLTTGRLMEYQNFYDKLANDSSDVDVFMAAWQLSSEPSPMALYSAQAPLNLSRFVTKQNTALLNAIDGQQALNENYRIQAFKQWQRYMLQEAFVVPMQYRTAVFPVSTRVKNYSIQVGAKLGWQDVQVTRSKP